MSPDLTPDSQADRDFFISLGSTLGLASWDQTGICMFCRWDYPLDSKGTLYNRRASESNRRIGVTKAGMGLQETP